MNHRFKSIRQVTLLLLAAITTGLLTGSPTNLWAAELIWSDDAVSTMSSAGNPANEEVASAPNNTPVAGLLVLRGAGRNTFDLNSGWLGHEGAMPGAEAGDFDASAWAVIDLSDATSRPLREAGDSKTERWYRKSFSVPRFAVEGGFLLRLDAVTGVGACWLNGSPAGDFSGKQSPVTLDLGERVRRNGEMNVIALRLTDDPEDPNAPAGIDGPAWLLNRSDVYVTDPPAPGSTQRSGVSSLVVSADTELATVHVRATIHNASDQSRRIMVIQSLRPTTANLPIQQRSLRVTLDPGETKTVLQQLEFRHPHLWTPDDPYLYHLDTRILEDLHALDGVRVEIPLRNPADI
jgi:beta-galactosidase